MKLVAISVNILQSDHARNTVSLQDHGNRLAFGFQQHVPDGQPVLAILLQRPTPFARKRTGMLIYSRLIQDIAFSYFP